MNRIFTADWHIKLGQKNVPIEWSKNRYKEFFIQLGTLTEKHCVDEIIIGGDIFDRLPTLEEQAIYYQFLLMFSSLSVDILIYPGNHEALKKNTTFLSYLKEVTKAANKRATIIDNWYSNTEYDIMPYNRLKEFAEKPSEPVNKYLFTHVRGEIPPHVQPEVNLSLFDNWEKVFAGDLHSHTNCQRNIIYPGSPITTSFHRTEVDTGIILIKSDWTWEFIKLTLPQLIRKTVTDTSEMVRTEYHHTIYELEGDLQEMSKIANVELLDKKIVTKESVSTLGLKKDMTIQEELAEYLKKVLSMSDDKVKQCIQKFNDYVQEAGVG